MQNAHPTPKVLLIVDDEENLRTSLLEVFEPFCDEVLTAEDGQKALGILKSRNVCAVLSDISMPQMNGIELLTAVRGMGMEIPFIFLTGYGDRENMREALRLGVSDFLDKPFDVDDLVNKVSVAIELGGTILRIEETLERITQDFKLPGTEMMALRKLRRTVTARKTDE